MTKTQEYIELLRNILEKKTQKRIYDKEIYTLLNVPAQTFSRYSRGERTMPEDIAFEIAHYVGVPPMQIIGEIKAEESKNENAKKWWLEQSKKAVGAFGAVCLVSATLLTTPNEAKASSNFSNQNNYILYELIKRRTHKKWLINCFRNFVGVFTHEIRRLNYAII